MTFCISTFINHLKSIVLETTSIFVLLLQDKAHVRKGHLDDSLQAHQYLADVAEAESWLKEKEPIVTSDDYGKDEDSAQVNIFVVFLSVSGLSFVPDV